MPPVKISNSTTMSASAATMPYCRMLFSIAVRIVSRVLRFSSCRGGVGALSTVVAMSAASLHHVTHQCLLSCLFSRHLAGEAALVERVDPIAHADQFRQLGGDDDDRLT